jgi:hypothetical protein
MDQASYNPDHAALSQGMELSDAVTDVQQHVS